MKLLTAWDDIYNEVYEYAECPECPECSCFLGEYAFHQTEEFPDPRLRNVVKTENDGGVQVPYITLQNVTYRFQIDTQLG